MDVKSRWSEEQRTEIVHELNRILGDAKFKNSKRCVTLLRYLVEHSVEGDSSGIKERSLGIEVFGRTPDYDCNADPVVRMTAGEIRKRLAQYYEEPSHHQAVRIRMVPGSYLLEFEFENLGQAAPGREFSAEVRKQLPSGPEAVGMNREGAAWLPAIRRKWLLCAALLLLVVGLGVILVLHLHPSTEYQLWKPLLSSDQDFILCVSDVRPQALEAKNDGSQREDASNPPGPRRTSNAGPANAAETILFEDANAAQKISDRLALAFKTKSILRPSSALTLVDFHRGSVVLIGGMYNPWSSMLLSKLRFSLHGDPAAGQFWIQDSQNPSLRRWQVSGGVEQAGVDYAVITRYLDPDTGNWILALGGFSPYGTAAAATLLTEPKLTPNIAANHFSGKNFQMILKTPVINGKAGNPQIVASFSW